MVSELLGRNRVEKAEFRLDKKNLAVVGWEYSTNEKENIENVKKLAQRAFCFVLIVYISVTTNIFSLKAIMFIDVDYHC